MEVTPEHLSEGGLARCFWPLCDDLASKITKGDSHNTHGFQHVVQWLQEVNHAHGIMVGEIETRRFLQTFVPQLVPKDGHPDQLMANNERLDKILATTSVEMGG